MPWARNRFERVVSDVAGDERRRHQQYEAQQRLRRPLRTIDQLVAELEELLLAGRVRVPMSFGSRLEELNRSLPDDLREEWRTGITIPRLTDRLFGLQEKLLHRLGLLRPWEEDGGNSDSAA